MEAGDAIVLEREAECCFIELTGEYSEFGKIGYVQAILTHMIENGGETTPGQLASSLLASNTVISEGLLKECLARELVSVGGERDGDTLYIITEKGTERAGLGIEMPPKKDVLEVVYSWDELLEEKYRILRRGASAGTTYQKTGNKDLIDAVGRMEGRIYYPSFGDTDPIMIYSVESERVGEDPGYHIRVRWTLHAGGGQELELIEDMPGPKRNLSDIVGALEIIGATPDMGRNEIKRLHAEKVLKWHPDRNKSPDANERIVAINNAYELITKNYNFMNDRPKLVQNRAALPDPMDYDNAWDVLMYHAVFGDDGWKSFSKRHDSYGWDPDNLRLRVRIKKGKESIIKSMSIMLDGSVKIPVVGTFKAEPREIGIWPISKDEARMWAEEWLLARLGDKYVTRDRYSLLTGEIETKFKEYGVSMGERSKYAPEFLKGVTADKNMHFWHVRAMEDWNL